MQVKRYFEVGELDSKKVRVDLGTHALIKSFAKERKISIAEAIYLLIGPAVAASQGLDFMEPMRSGGFLAERTAGLPAPRHNSQPEAKRS